MDSGTEGYKEELINKWCEEAHVFLNTVHKKLNNIEKLINNPTIHEDHGGNRGNESIMELRSKKDTLAILCTKCAKFKEGYKCRWESDLKWTEPDHTLKCEHYKGDKEIANEQT